MPNRERELGAVWRQRLTRRSLLHGAAAFGGVVVGGSVIGCGGSSEPLQQTVVTGSPTASALPKRGGTAEFATARQMVDLNPWFPANNPGTQQLVYDQLFFNDGEDKMYLSLAASFEQPDQLTYIFKIKPSAKFQNVPPVNGRNVTSQDAVTSWNAYRDNPRTGNKVIFTQVIDRYEMPDASTLIVKTKNPYAYTLSGTHLGGAHPAVVIPRELIEKDLLGKVAVGAGPYVVDQFDPASTISFVRRPDGWHTGDNRPYIDKKIYRVISDPAARAAAFRAKQIDTLVPGDRVQAEEFKTFGPGMVIGTETDTGDPGHLCMRADPGVGYFADVRVREAVYNALDIKEIVDTVEMGDGQYSGPVPSYVEGYVLPQEELKKYFPHDIAKAKQLLAAANWDSNLTVDFKYPASDTSALFCQVIQTQLAVVGIKTRLVPQESTTVYNPQTIAGRDFQLTGSVATSRLADPNTALTVQTTAGRGDGNQCRWSDPEVDAAVAKQQVEFDKEKQRQMILDAQRLLLKKFTPWIIVYASVRYNAHWSYYHPAKEQGWGGLVGIKAQYDWTEKA